VKYSATLNVKNPRFFDIAHDGKTYHGKYEPAKSAIASIKYVTKHDQEPLELGSMDYKQETQAKECKKKILGKRLIEGESLVSLTIEYPEMLDKYQQW